MATQPKTLYPIISQPGVKRDGTALDSNNYSDAQWCRFQRGKPKKMGGYRSVSSLATGPVRDLLVDSRSGVNTAHISSPWGIQRIQFDSSGAGGAVYDRTPATYVYNDNNTWESDILYASGGVNYAALVAAATPDVYAIDSDVAGPLYFGDVTATAVLTPCLDSDGLTALTVSGGCAVLQPFLFIYGSNGLIRNSNANAVSGAAGWATGGANYSNTANPAGTKIVKGLAMRGGTSAPAGLFWSLDSLIRVTFVGGTAIWRYDTLSSQTSILSKRCVIEYDGVYYWLGVDRFLVYSGVVQELPNQMSINWFFDNLNYAQRQKVWAMKMPRYGEIWWFYPRGDATECTDAIIYNVREQLWYDCKLARSAGYQSEVFNRPVMAGTEEQQSTIYFTYTPTAGVFNIGATVTGGTSGATGTVARVLTGMNVATVTGTFVNGETISAGSITGTVTSVPASQLLNVVWQHEIGHDKVLGQQDLAIPSWFETSNIGFPTGGAMEPISPTSVDSQQKGVSIGTRVVTLEPDFIQTGDLSLYVRGQKYANSPVVDSAPYAVPAGAERVDLREQRRLLTLKFESNVLGGHYEMGQPLVAMEPGDTHG